VGLNEAGLNVTSRLRATGRVTLTAMPTDAATEAVEHVRNLASERREVFDPAELIDDFGGRFATLVGDGHACVPAPVLGLTATPPARPLSRRRRGPTAAAPAASNFKQRRI
jgi:hypothetical protein